eukprot:12405639-Karenia_brevis.AAC.1
MRRTPPSTTQSSLASRQLDADYAQADAIFSNSVAPTSVGHVAPAFPLPEPLAAFFSPLEDTGSAGSRK